MTHVFISLVILSSRYEFCHNTVVTIHHFKLNKWTCMLCYHNLVITYLGDRHNGARGHPWSTGQIPTGTLILDINWAVLFRAYGTKSEFHWRIGLTESIYIRHGMVTRAGADGAFTRWSERQRVDTSILKSIFRGQTCIIGWVVSYNIQ